MTPQEIASTIYKTGNHSKIFGRISLISTVDTRLDDKAHRILCLLAACAWKAAAPLSFEEIASGARSAPSSPVLCLGYPRVSKELKAFRDEMKEKYPADMVDELFAEVLPQL